MTEPHPPINLAYEGESPAHRLMMTHIINARCMVRDLPPYAHDGQADLPPVVRAGCLEAFFVNVRLLAEFLTHSPRPKDFTAHDFVQGWIPKPDDAAERLRTKWLLASQHVVHLSRKRVPPDPQNIDYEDTSLPGLQAIADDCAAVWRHFELYAGLVVLPGGP